MSALAFEIQQGKISVAVDTLATDELGENRCDVSKALYVPHLDCLFAVTGALFMLDRLPDAIMRNMVSRGSEFTLQASDILQELWIEHIGPAAISLGSVVKVPSTSVFQFGFSSKSGLPECFMYHSSDDFQPRPLEGSAHKPANTIPGDRIEYPMEFVRVIDGLRNIEEARRFEDRIHIGGRVILHTLMPKFAAVMTIHDFGD